MRRGEFPKLAEYETPEREIEMEQLLPGALKWSLNFFLERYLFLLKALQHEGSGDLIQRVKKINRPQAHNRVLEQIKTGHYLEALAMLDVTVRYLEIEADTLDYIPEDERDAGWKEEKDKTMAQRNTIAYHYDRMIEKEPRLRKEYSKKDFENWAKEIMSNRQSSLKEETDEDDRSDLLEELSALDRVLEHEVLSREEIFTLLFEINAEAALYREGIGELVVNYLLGEKVQEGQLLDNLGNILKFRQFNVGVESGEWIKIKGRT